MSGTGFQRTVCIGDGAASIVVEVGLDVAADDSTKGSYKVVDLSWCCAARNKLEIVAAFAIRLF